MARSDVGRLLTLYKFHYIAKINTLYIDYTVYDTYLLFYFSILEITCLEN